MRRGRPRHDDILTPREWQVLDLLRDGLTNEQIAERLGISYDTAKFHVSEILGKLGVESRQEAAAWRGKPRVAFGLAPVFGLLQRVASLGPLKLAGAGAIGVASVGLVALFVGVLLSTGANVPSEPVPTVPVQWTEAELPDPVSWEAPRPFEDVVGPDEEDVWRAYLVKDDGKPQLIAETNRELLPQITWSGDEDHVQVRVAQAVVQRRAGAADLRLRCLRARQPPADVGANHGRVPGLAFAGRHEDAALAALR